MLLLVNGKPISEDASNVQITNSLYTITGKKDTVVLSKNNVQFMQSTGTPASGLALEYQDGPIGENYKCVNSALSIEQVAKAFKNYLAENKNWKSDLSWEKTTFSSISKASNGKIINILTGPGLAGYLIWKYFFAS